MNQTLKTPALGVTAGRLALAYGELNPGEFELKNLPEIEEAMGNWLEKLSQQPEKAIATTNWAGKVTQALFYALGIDSPKTKKSMLELLENPPKAVRIVEYELDYVHRVQVAVPSVSDEDAIARAEEAFENGTIWDDTQGMPVLFDDFEESDSNTLAFKVIDTVPGMGDLPPKDASVLAHIKQVSAQYACSLLLQACETAKKSGKDYVSLDALTAACEAAASANTGDQKSIKVLVEIEGGACIGTYASAPVEIIVMDADKAQYGEVYEGDSMHRISFPDGIEAKSVLSRGKLSIESKFVREVFSKHLRPETEDAK